MIRALAALALLPPLGGCVAAAIPVVASGAIVKQRMEARRDARTAAPAKPADGDAPRARILTGVTELPPPGAAARPAAPAAGARAVPETMQYLYGSGEAAGLSLQAYGALTDYLVNVVPFRRAEAQRQAVLADGASLNQPFFEECGGKPRAVVLDIDETAVLNLGYEADAARRGVAFDEARWGRWETGGADKVVAVPGAKAALDAARKAGIAVIFNSNRSAANAAATEAALAHAGLGPAKHGETLWLKGDDGGGSGKDERRWAIASGYCVVALVGDQLGDFSDLFNAAGLAPSTRRALAAAPALAGLWGRGWFLLPNPVYGPALKGGYDDVFPQDMRWNDPAEEKK